MKVTIADEILLVHGALPYDPVKAHEYYMRTRQLKGRAGGPKITPSSRGSRTPVKSGAQFARKKPISKSEAKARVAAIEKRLGALKSVLASLLKQDKAEKADAASKKAKSNATKSASSDQKLTAKQKADARERSKDYYDKNKKQIADKRQDNKPKEKTTEEKIKVVRQQIKTVEASLASAKAKLNAS